MLMGDRAFESATPEPSKPRPLPQLDMLLDWLQHRELAESEMTAFETESVESCRSLGWIQRVFSAPSRSFRSGRNVPQDQSSFLPLHQARIATDRAAEVLTARS